MLTAADLLGGFESLGDNCEFGVLQRAAGIEPLGFFRLNFSPLPALMRALATDFAGIDREDHFELVIQPDKEYFVRVVDYGFTYHTMKFVGQVAPEALHRQQVATAGFLIRKLREDLAAAEKIFVRKGEDSTREEDILALHQALRRYGPATLLWVVREDQAHRAGLVEVLRPGLLKGYIDRFAPLDDAHDVSPMWFHICRHALALWRGSHRPGIAMVSANTEGATNLIVRPDVNQGPGWRTGTGAASKASEAVPRFQPAGSVIEHIRLEPSTVVTENAYFHFIHDGLISGETYVGSMYVWLPSDSAATGVEAVADGYRSTFVQRADLSKRDMWQRIYVTVAVPQGLRSVNLALVLRGAAGSSVYSTCWQFERGTEPNIFTFGTVRRMQTLNAPASS